MTSQPKRKTLNLGHALPLLYMIGLGYFLFQLSTGSSYYLTPMEQRPFHADYGVYKPAGSKGLFFGVVGTAMMLTLLLYSLRKRTRIFGRVFHLKHWLDVHIWFGVMGPLLILLHTSFRLNGLVAISFWSMMAVAASGVFGRYLYTQIPHDLDGDEIQLSKLKEREGLLATQLNQNLQLAGDQWLLFTRSFGADPHKQWGLLSMMVADLKTPLIRRGLHRRLLHQFGLPSGQAAYLTHMGLDLARVQRRLSRPRQLRRLFHYWHVMHRPVALIMYLIMAVHIVVALLFGVSWSNPF